jgi:hypothetical protein
MVEVTVMKLRKEKRLEKQRHPPLASPEAWPVEDMNNRKLARTSSSTVWPRRSANLPGDLTWSWISSSGGSGMSGTVQLARKAHWRFGDKGDTGLFIFVPYDARDFETLVESVTAECESDMMSFKPCFYMTACGSLRKFSRQPANLAVNRLLRPPAASRK